MTVFQPLAVSQVIVNNGSAQRSNIETLTFRFNQNANFQELIDNGTIASIVQLAGGGPSALAASRFRYDAATFSLTVDLTGDGFGGSHQTLLTDGGYQLRLGTNGIHAFGQAANTLLDDDGLNDGARVVAFRRLQGDFNGDARVSLADRDFFFARFGTKAGQTNYEFAYVLNGDGVITIADYLLWSRLLGKKV